MNQTTPGHKKNEIQAFSFNEKAGILLSPTEKTNHAAFKQNSAAKAIKK